MTLGMAQVEIAPRGLSGKATRTITHSCDLVVDRPFAETRSNRLGRVQLEQLLAIISQSQLNIRLGMGSTVLGDGFQGTSTPLSLRWYYHTLSFKTMRFNGTSQRGKPELELELESDN